MPPQVMPLTRVMTVSMSMPSMSALMAARLPGQPPMKDTWVRRLSWMSKVMRLEHTPLGLKLYMVMTSFRLVVLYMIADGGFFAMVLLFLGEKKRISPSWGANIVRISYDYGRLGLGMMESVCGVVDGIVFESEDGSFSVFRVKTEGGSVVSVVGSFSAPLVGEQVEVQGTWTEHPKFGAQLRAQSVRRMAPTGRRGLIRFLSSGAVKGVGPLMAERLYDHFGSEVLHVLEHEPSRLREVHGIGKKKAAEMHSSYLEQSEMRDLMLFLEEHGVSGAYAARIFAQYGSFAVEYIKESPYRLAEEVRGIGFRTADTVAMSLGLGRNDRARIKAGVEYALSQVMQAGHCCVPEEILVQETARLLTADRQEVASEVRRLKAAEELYVESPNGMTLIYPRAMYHAERGTAERLLYLRDKARRVDADGAEERARMWEAESSLVLSDSQREALMSSLRYGVLVLTGGPGTGKTTVIRGILTMLEAEGFQILLGAPTGRAAKRLSEATGRQASTVHRMLEAMGAGDDLPAMFERNEDEPLEADVVIIDEVSMMDIGLMYALLKAVPSGCRVILAGDVDQLPAVGPGSVLKDVIRSEAIPTVRLTEVFRQAGESRIVMNAHRINRGVMPDVDSSDDFCFLEYADARQAAERIVTLCREELPAEGVDVLREVQVLSPMHRLECGVENLNRLLQESLNAPDAAKAEMNGPRCVFREGDKVMQTKNNYQKNVFNGDIGFVERIADGRMTVSFGDADVVYERKDIDELSLAYAMSVHKSQGSEYPIVILPLTAGHHVMLQRNLLYTAVTRAKKQVILLGTKAALYTAVDNDRMRKRYTLLAQRLSDAVVLE